MFWNRENREKKKLAKIKKQEAYDRIYRLHQEATFLCYIDEVCLEEYEGNRCIKLVGTMALGEGTVDEKYRLYSCEGKLKSELDIEEFYVGADATKKLECDDKTVAIYPKPLDVSYKAGDILCKLRDA